MTLERTYRGLLTLYPTAHRRQYEEEMLGVLLASAGQRRRPGVRDVLDLLGGAMRARARGLTAGPGERWRDAAAAFGLIGALVMLAYSARNVILAYGPGGGLVIATSGEWSYIMVDVFEPWDIWPRLAVWALVALAAATRLRRIAATLAWGAVALETLIAFGGYPLSSLYVNTQLWVWALTLVIASALTLPVARSGAAVLGRGRTALLVTAGVIGTAGATTVFLMGRDGEGLTLGWSFTRTTHPAEIVADAVGLVLGAASLLSLPAALRRRVLAFLAPVAVTVLVNRYPLYDWVYSSEPWVSVASPPTMAQSLALVGIPLLTFAVAAVLVRLVDRAEHVIGLRIAAGRRR